jgi:hypothetical protein
MISICGRRLPPLDAKIDACPRASKMPAQY